MNEEKKGFSAGVVLMFILGIVALLALIGYSVWNGSPPILLGGEGAVLISLIALLVYAVSARKKQLAGERSRSKSPYGDADKAQITKIFDMIDKEERSRGGVFIKTSAGVASAASAEETSEQPVAAADEPTVKTEDDDEDRLPIIFPDKDDYEDNNAAAFTPLSEERAATRREKREKEAAKALEENDEAQNKDESTDGAEGESPTQEEGETEEGGKSMDKGKPKKRGPGVYYDAYGRPVAPPRQQPVGYDAYGRPIYQRPPVKRPRAPIGYDAYGRPIYAPMQKKPRVPIGYDAYGRPIYAAPGAKHPGQRRRPPTQAGQAQGQQAAQIPTEPMAASAADALASIEARQNTSVPSNYYDEDYVPVVVHDDEDMDYDDGRYTPTVRAGILHGGEAPKLTDADTVPLYSSPTVPSQPIRQLKSEYNLSGDGTYKPDYSGDDMPVIVPSYEDMEVDYSTSQGFTPPPDYSRGNYSSPVPGSAEVQSGRKGLDPSFNASSANDYVRDSEDDDFVYVPRFDDDDPDTPAEPPKPQEPSWKMAKMRRRKVRRRSRRGMLFKVKDMSFVDYTNSIVG